MPHAPAAPTPPAAFDGRRSLRRAIAVVWAGFWLLMVAAETQRHSTGFAALWHALVQEGSSAFVATLLLVVQWKLAGRLDHQLARPARWFAVVLALTLPLAFTFVPLVHGLRLGLYALAGSVYPHEPLSRVFFYETARFAIFYLLFCGLQFGARSYLAFSAARLQAEHERALAREAQLLQLAQQLQPHFLFNALNTVSALIHTDPDRADLLLTRLASLLRAASDVAHRPQQPLDDELRLLHAYADIMCERFADRVRIDWDVDDAALSCPVPTLALQPLLENCFRHVVEQRSQPTRISVRARCLGHRLQLTVQDDGGALTAPVRFGVGLGNLEQRLRALHGSGASLVLSPAEPGGVTATLELPCAC